MVELVKLEVHPPLTAQERFSLAFRNLERAIDAEYSYSDGFYDPFYLTSITSSLRDLLDAAGSRNTWQAIHLEDATRGKKVSLDKKDRNKDER